MMPWASVQVPRVFALYYRGRVNPACHLCATLFVTSLPYIQDDREYRTTGFISTWGLLLLPPRPHSGILSRAYPRRWREAVRLSEMPVSHL